MIAKPYPAYKDSGLPWLEKIPAHWELRRMKFLMREIDLRSQYGKEQLLRVSQYTGITPRHSIDGSDSPDTRASSLVGYRRVEQNDLVINIMLAWNGSLGVSRFDGIVSPAYCVYRFDSGLKPRFFDYLLHAPVYKARIKVASTGVVESRLRLYSDDLGRIETLLPPPDEQSAIVRYLDHANQRIVRYIRVKRKLIALLNEQKQAIIHCAVTRGLDPNVRLKSSGIAWLGDVPEHWKVSRVKNEFACLDNRRIPLNSVERGGMTKKQYDYYGASSVIDKVEDFIFDDELLLIAEDGANLVLRNLPLAVIARGKFWVNNHAHILKPIRGNLEYLASVLETINYLPWISGAAQPKLTRERLMSISIAVAPPEEQVNISRQFFAETEPLRIAISRAEHEIELIREYRTRLIADVVTGKVDVRTAAQQLPATEIAETETPSEIEDDELAEESEES